MAEEIKLPKYKLGDVVIFRRVNSSSSDNPGMEQGRIKIAEFGSKALEWRYGISTGMSNIKVLERDVILKIK